MFYMHNHMKLNYTVIGIGKPILIIHGLACSSKLMMGCLEPIFKDTVEYQRIYVDLPGMGESNFLLDYASADKMLEVLTAFLKTVMDPDDHFLLIGQSYGGYLARGLLALMPDRIDGLFLLCPVVLTGKTQRNLPMKRTLFLEERFFASIATEEKNDFLAYAVIADEHTYTRYKNEIEVGLKAANQAFIGRLLQNYHFGFDVDKCIHAAPFMKPTLLITGRQDAEVGYRDLLGILEDYPRATYSVLDTAGHNLQIEQPEVFEMLVQNWLKRILAYQ